MGTFIPKGQHVSVALAALVDVVGYSREQQTARLADKKLYAGLTPLATVEGFSTFDPANAPAPPPSFPSVSSAGPVEPGSRAEIGLILHLTPLRDLDSDTVEQQIQSWAGSQVGPYVKARTITIDEWYYWKPATNPLPFIALGIGGLFLLWFWRTVRDPSAGPAKAERAARAQERLARQQAAQAARAAPVTTYLGGGSPIAFAPMYGAPQPMVPVMTTMGSSWASPPPPAKQLVIPGLGP